MKTSELTGVALDWAVAKCEGREAKNTSWGGWMTTWSNPQDDGALEYEKLPHYSTNWAQGGPIIEREGISVLHTTMRPSLAWEASHTPSEHLTVCEFGQTPLIAAMRCYVASKLGDEIEVPEELWEEA